MNIALLPDPSSTCPLLLAGQGADLVHHDPNVPVLAEQGLTGASFEEALRDVDLAIVVTAHPGVDHELVAERAPVVLDLRGVLRQSAVTNVTRS